MREVTASHEGNGLEIDIEYANGFRETVEVFPGETFTMPFAGKVCAARALEPSGGQ